ncbi:hypothetical protein [Nonomuraea rhodomycinica]|uniref:Uncharacterized protein n=1 Tax=Nonomuraea rhodomycinica TaxID=1712872 RepID=A0A7Y6IRE9_9ACTN|nr:hypothetical protein [Nonomuraea rhodomycinica]NUW42726.1 hypothetical protein [Nonomuraea rhodomycinica]
MKGGPGGGAIPAARQASAIRWWKGGLSSRGDSRRGRSARSWSPISARPAAGCRSGRGRRRGRTDLLAVLTPGVDRLGYFRRLGRVQHGLEPFDGLLPVQERYDVHFVQAAGWPPSTGTAR